MRRAKADFEIFADDGETTKPLKRFESPRKEGSKSKSPPSETRPATKCTARPKQTVTETAGLKVLGNNNKENIDPRFGKPAGKKKNGNTAPKTDTALQSPPNKVLTALNDKNRNVLPGKSLKKARPIDKPAHCTPKPKQAPPKTSTIPFSPLADITEAYNSKCPTPLPLSVSFSGTSTVTVERRLEQASAAILKTGVSELHAELHNLPSSEEGKKTELGKINKLREDLSPKPVVEGEHRNYSAICPTEPKVNQPKDHIDDKSSRCDFTEQTKESAATTDAPRKIIEVLRSSSQSTMKPILSGSGNSSTDAHRAAEISAPATPIQNDWSKQEPKERSNNSINNLKRKSLNNVDVNDKYPNKRYRDENYIACTDLLEIKLGADRSATTMPEKKPSFKRFILECAPGW